MGPERNRTDVRVLAKEYKSLAEDLRGFVHNEAMHEEFQRLDQLEKLLFDEGLIFEDPAMLLGMNLALVEKDEDDYEKVVEMGKIGGVETDGAGGIRSIIFGHNFLHSTPLTRFDKTTMRLISPRKTRLSQKN